MRVGTFKRTLRALVPITCSECGYPRGMKTETGKITCSRCGTEQCKAINTKPTYWNISKRNQLTRRQLFSKRVISTFQNLVCTQLLKQTGIGDY